MQHPTRGKPSVSAPPASDSETAARPSTVRWWVLAALCAAAVIAYIQRTSIGVLKLPIQAELELDKEQLGRVMSGFFLCYALAQVPLGRLGERWGSRRSLALYVAAWSVGVAMMSLARDLTSLFAVWCLVGVVQGGLFPVTMTAVRAWLPASRRALASGLLGACMSLGGAVGNAAAGTLLGDQVHWSIVFLILAAPGLLFAAAFFAWFRDRPEEHPSVNAGELAIIRMGVTTMDAAHAGGGQSHFAAQNRDSPRGQNRDVAQSAPAAVPWGRLLASPAMWCIAGQHLCRAAAYALFLTSFAEYLKEAHGLTPAQAGVWASWPLVAVVVGSPLGGIASDWVLARTGSRRASRQRLAVVGLLAAAVLTLSAIALDSGWAVLLVMAGGTFCQAFGGANGYTITLDMGGRHATSVFSLMNMAGSLGATMLPWTVGWFVERTGHWDWVIVGVAGIYAAGAVFWMLLDPDGTVIEE